MEYNRKRIIRIAGDPFSIIKTILVIVAFAPLTSACCVQPTDFRHYQIITLSNYHIPPRSFLSAKPRQCNGKGASFSRLALHGYLPAVLLEKVFT